MQFNYLSVSKEIKCDLDKFSKSPTSTKNGKSQRVVVRFPPEPSGYLHLGHIKALSINNSIALHYKGDLILRMDDTNPLLESEEFERSIIDDVKTLGVGYTTLTHTSDYFGTLLQFAETLIRSGDAYVDYTDATTIKEERNNAVESKYRKTSPEDNLAMWEQLKSGAGAGCVRLKIDMSSKNKAMRDPIIYRTITTHQHHRTGDSYKVYPTYDFSCPIVDSIEGVTHVFRSREFQERDEMCVWILKKLELASPKLYHYGKLNVVGAVMSKRKIKELVTSGAYSGWDDPRLYTLRGLLNRGVTFQTLDMFMKETGYPILDVNVEPSTLWGINRKVVDKVATRFCVVPVERAVKVQLDLPGDMKLSKDVLRFYRSPSLGMRTLHFGTSVLVDGQDLSRLGVDSEEVTLMNFGNVLYIGGKFVSKLDGDPKGTQHKLVWVTENCTDVTIVDYDQKDDRVETKYKGELEIRNVKVGEFVQFMKMDYYLCTKVHDNAAMFVRVP